MAQKPTKLKALPTAETPPDYVLDSQVGFLMRVAMQRHTSIFMSNMIEDLTQTQFAVLAKLHEVGPSSQNHLGRLVYLDAATIKGVVDRLGLRGFITTGSDPTDRRRRAVSLTEKGARVVDAAIRVAAEVSAKTLRPLTAEEQRTLTRLLKKIT
ncbi:MarR family winged helix-turn-helix transcriptional regulator [Tardiphaga sp. 20_F10_N6_6]|jgi:DNA-binding MarR family transcriptional regulator|uniref:MarR family winged helix-turn-helix transcriptional regulator n=1 Tax=Nitrobacteraceae TaxID=41294 RepID=UPI0008A80218|nr:MULTISPECIES: MarR family transcriptional regulator [Nitrobacteraceae]SEI08383.1 DNA-binding transcriptional regulator, MarR family [Tardiphaga sp. OK245]SFM23756.1 DNA-binding transcriptional regulator, MarR family [Bradyrhizobium sp. NFR13]